MFATNKVLAVTKKGCEYAERTHLKGRFLQLLGKPTKHGQKGVRKRIV